MIFKTKKMITTIKNTGLSIFLITAVLALSSCAKKVSFLTSSVVPAAHGYVKMKKDNNKNYVIHIQLSDLADVSRLEPSRKAYIVWMDTDEQQAKNLGQINSSGSMLSSRKKSSFETVSPVKPIRIFITAEDDHTVQSPGSQVVLSTDKF